MISRLCFVLLALCTAFLWIDASHAQAALSPAKNAGDFDYLYRTIHDKYAYFDQKHIDWEAIGKAYRARAASAGSRKELVTVLEQTLEELHDPHTGLQVNTDSSPRLIPTGLDLWAEWSADRKKAVITQVRPGFGAEQSGLRAGMEIQSVNGVPIHQATAARLWNGKKEEDPVAWQWALLAVLAGQHDTPRFIRVAGISKPFAVDAPGLHHPDDETFTPRVETKTLAGGIGYIRLRDLGSSDVNPLFDHAIASFHACRGLILDLRETPRGGNTDVGEHVIGAFLTKTQRYQEIIPRHGESWFKTAAPLSPEKRYGGALVILVNRWTGSMGEGIAVALDGTSRGIVVGTRMAGLNGEVFSDTLPNSGISFQYTGSKIMTVKGILRETFRPPVYVELEGNDFQANPHPILAAGMRQLVAEERTLNRVP